MKLRNFFFAALAATFAFASCDKADSNDGTNGDSAYAGNWFLSVTVDGVEKVAGLKTASYGYIPIEDAVVEGGVINSYVENVYTFAETNGGYTIQDSEGKYLYMGQKSDGTWYNSFQLSTELPESNAVWTIEEQEDGTVKIVNSDQNAYVLQCSTGQYTSFGVYEGVQENYLLPKLVKADNPVEKPATPAMVWTPGDKFASETANINGTEGVSVVKLGTSDAVGSGKIIIPAGTQKLSFYGVAWKGKSGEVTITGNGVNKTLSFTANGGATGNKPYTITAADSDKYELTFSPALTANTELTFTTVASKYRVIMWGFVAE